MIDITKRNNWGGEVGSDDVDSGETDSGWGPEASEEDDPSDWRYRDE